MIHYDQLDIYIFFMYALVLSFLNKKGFVILLRKWMRLKKCSISISLLLVSLTLTLSIATAIVEKAFSAMKVTEN
jgi:hypothetical protein